MASIDPSIALGIRPIQVKDPLEQYGQVLGIQGAQQANALRAMQMDQARMAMEDDRATQNALRAYYGSDRGDMALRSLAQASPKAFQAEQKRILEEQDKRSEIGKRNADIKQQEIDVALKRVGTFAQASRMVNSQQDYDMLYNWAYQNFGADGVKDLPAQYDPKRLELFVNATLKDADVLAKQREKREQDNALIQRGEDGRPRINQMAVQAKSAVAQAGAPVTYGSPVPVQLPGGQLGLVQPGNRAGAAPQVVTVPDRSGNRVPVSPAKPDGGQPTEDERRSAGLAVRMEGALKRVQEITNRNAQAAKPTIVERGVGAVSEDAANVIRSADRQSVDTAQLDALDAALTLATGAAYTREQIKGLSKSYFPQIGDSEQVIADKEKRFQDVIQTARIRAGRSSGTIDQVLNRSSAAPSGWRILGREE